MPEVFKTSYDGDNLVIDCNICQENIGKFTSSGTEENIKKIKNNHLEKNHRLCLDQVLNNQ